MLYITQHLCICMILSDVHMLCFTLIVPVRIEYSRQNRMSIYNGSCMLRTRHCKYPYSSAAHILSITLMNISPRKNGIGDKKFIDILKVIAGGV